MGCGAKEFSTGAARQAWGKLLAADFGDDPCQGSVLSEKLPRGGTPTLALDKIVSDALNCSLFRLFLAHFSFEFVAQFDEVKNGGTGRGVFHDPFPARARRQVASLGRLNAQLEFE